MVGTSQEGVERTFGTGRQARDAEQCWAAGGAGHVLVSGGLGALGSLVAAWLTGASAVAHQPALTLLGRSGRISDPGANRLLQASHHQVSFK